MAKISKTVTFDFEFINADGEEDIRELTMKSSRLMPRRIGRLPVNQVTTEAMRWAMSEEDFAWLEELPHEANGFDQNLATAWQKASGVELGESKAS